MHRLTTCTGAVLVFLSLSGAQPRMGAAQAPSSGTPQRIALAEQLAAGKLRAVSRQVSRLQEKPDAVRLTEAKGPGVVWIDGSDFAEGTIEIDVRGRDVVQRSFVGIAFHRRDDNTYEAVYLRPFNTEK